MSVKCHPLVCVSSGRYTSAHDATSASDSRPQQGTDVLACHGRQVIHGNAADQPVPLLPPGMRGQRSHEQCERECGNNFAGDRQAFAYFPQHRGCGLTVDAAPTAPRAPPPRPDAPPELRPDGPSSDPLTILAAEEYEPMDRRQWVKNSVAMAAATAAANTGAAAGTGHMPRAAHASTT